MGVEGGKRGVGAGAGAGTVEYVGRECRATLGLPMGRRGRCGGEKERGGVAKKEVGG